MLAAGAAGARLGTRFVATVESGAHDTYKQAIVEATADSTEITDAFAACPLCATSPRARVLRNCIDAVHGLTEDAAGETTLGGAPFTIEKGSGLPPGATAIGRIDAMAMYAGESARLVQSTAAVADVMAQLVDDASRLLAAW